MEELLELLEEHVRAVGNLNEHVEDDHGERDLSFQARGQVHGYFENPAWKNNEKDDKIRENERAAPYHLPSDGTAPQNPFAMKFYL